jgi:hypothetical protein
MIFAAQTPNQQSLRPNREYLYKEYLWETAKSHIAKSPDYR